MPDAPKLFISYAHKDRSWLDQLLVHLRPMKQQNKVALWTDQEILTGANWHAEIEKALREADIAVLLVTPAFIDSGFIHDKELPELLKKQVVWVAVESSLYKYTPLANLQCANDPSRALDTLQKPARNRAWVNICEKILQVASALPTKPLEIMPEVVTLSSESRPYSRPHPIFHDGLVVTEPIGPLTNENIADSQETPLLDTGNTIPAEATPIIPPVTVPEQETTNPKSKDFVGTPPTGEVKVIETPSGTRPVKLFVSRRRLLAGIGGLLVASGSGIAWIRTHSWKRTRINLVDGAKMIYIPAGPFRMGDADQVDNQPHTVTLDGYWIYEKLVTVKQYRQFCKETYRYMRFQPSWGWEEDLPIVDVNWNDAKAYCDWANVALPTEAQWEKAARGPEGFKYPWGNEWDGSKCANSVYPNKLSSAVPVGKFAANGYGLYDMAGNVWQWCADWYDQN